jgi:hypothetical protein
VTVDAEEDGHHRRDEDDDDPGPLRELGYGQHADHRTGEQGTKRVDRQFASPPPVVVQDGSAGPDELIRLQPAGPAPVHDHSSLRHGERKKHADRVQRDERRDIRPEDDHQPRGDDGECRDSGRED